MGLTIVPSVARLFQIGGMAKLQIAELAPIQELMNVNMVSIGIESSYYRVKYC